MDTEIIANLEQDIPNCAKCGRLLGSTAYQSGTEMIECYMSAWGGYTMSDGYMWCTICVRQLVRKAQRRAATPK